MNWKIKTLSDWDLVAEEILKHFSGKKIFALYGEMGAGKTTLVKSFCKALGATDEAVSPTFSLVNEYSIKPHPKSLSQGEGLEYSDKIFHFDLYRLKSATELLDIGFEEYLSGNHYCFIEWAELAEPFLTDETIHLKIFLPDETETRMIEEISQS